MEIKNVIDIIVLCASQTSKKKGGREGRSDRETVIMSLIKILLAARKV